MKKVMHFGKELLQRIDKADVTGLSAQLAYFFLLSLFPFLLFLVTLLGFLPIDDRAVTDALGAYLPEEVAVMIETNLSSKLIFLRESLKVTQQLVLPSIHFGHIEV